MKAVQFDFSVARYAYTRIASRFNPREYYGPRSCVSLRDVPEPRLRGPEWLVLRSVFSGFCGSDLGAITLHDSPTTQPFTSFPFTFGHENASVVEEVGNSVSGVSVGQRVTIIPPLGCRVRGIETMCAPCRSGYNAICENFAEGNLSPGTNTGFCRDTGGGWSKYYLAHESQIVKIPESLTNEQACMIENLCSALYPVMRAMPEEGENVLVMGCGPIGLGVIASIRALGVKCHITAIEPAELNRCKAKEKGADEVIDPSSESIYERASKIAGGKIYKPILEKHILMGGFDRIFDCVGSTDTINLSFRLAGGGATMVLIGIQVTGKIDWTPVWMKGLRVIGNLGYGEVVYEGERTHCFNVAIDLILKGKIDMTDLITHRFSIEEYKRAVEVNTNKAKYGAIKTIFDLTDQ
ncbi:MAG: alcohol dehydrogenase catalytic domain-containing protein [Actinomycetota bacterium]|nr:alcohol dehydrogenase catalytic domain-containing protein [Actinomycetota bacterium]